MHKCGLIQTFRHAKLEESYGQAGYRANEEGVTFFKLKR